MHETLIPVPKSSARPDMPAPRWTRPAVEALYALPFNELLHRAHGIHGALGALTTTHSPKLANKLRLAPLADTADTQKPDIFASAMS